MESIWNSDNPVIKMIVEQSAEVGIDQTIFYSKTTGFKYLEWWKAIVDKVSLDVLDAYITTDITGEYKTKVIPQMREIAIERRNYLAGQGESQ
ncbi:hypothetical protein EEL32_15160 [Brevibacillus laterosporus]|nr:hypothetical protein [Brevibacillus laterosporus]TPG84978.1 hypothetical protein EEL32_15160 [Brevibacillus laterosporus]